MGPKNKTIAQSSRIGAIIQIIRANNMMVVPWIITPTLPAINMQSDRAGAYPGFTTYEQTMNVKLLPQH